VSQAGYGAGKNEPAFYVQYLTSMAGLSKKPLHHVKVPTIAMVSFLEENSNQTQIMCLIRVKKLSNHRSDSYGVDFGQTERNAEYFNLML